MKYDFKLEEHEEFGYVGLKAMFMRGAEPATGLTCAHDIIEHFRGLNLDSDSEAMALGATLYIRGMTGWFRRGPYHKSIGHAISGDLARLYADSYR